MKRIITMALVLVMGLSLVACGTNEKEVMGTWKNTTANNHDFTLVLEEDNAGTMKMGETEMGLTWKVEDEQLVIEQMGQKEILDIVKNEDKIEISYRDGYYILVSEAEYDNLFEEVEITKDNWQDYFEFRDGIMTYENEFEEISSIYYGTEFNVKEEYEEKCMGADLAIEYELKDHVVVSVEYNTETEEITVSDPLTEAEIEDKGYYNNPDETASGTTSFETYNLDEDFALNGYMGPQNDNWEMKDNIIKFDAQAYQTPEIVRIEGTIVVKK